MGFSWEAFRGVGHDYATSPKEIDARHGFDPRLQGFPVSFLYVKILRCPPDLTTDLLFQMCAFDAERVLLDERLLRCVQLAGYLPDPSSFIDDEGESRWPTTRLTSVPIG